jgi:hypothetical protein
MPYSKSDFLNDLDAILAENIVVGASIDDLQTEIDANMWWITASADVLESLSPNELLDFVMRLTDDRRAKIRHSNADHGMYFYLWFDEQAYQLRFSLISDMHTELPFGATLNIIDTPVPIVGAFLTDYLTSAPRLDVYVLDVYVSHLI